VTTETLPGGRVVWAFAPEVMGSTQAGPGS
jgi:hypothetical protein